MHRLTREESYVATFHLLSIVVGRQRSGAGAHFLAGQLASHRSPANRKPPHVTSYVVGLRSIHDATDATNRYHDSAHTVSCIHALNITQPRAMGNANTSLVTQTSASTCCLVVEPQSAFPRGHRGINRTKPQGLVIDDLLWSEVVQEIDPLARRLNAGFCTALLLYITIIGVFVGLGASGVIKQYNDDGPSMFLIVVWAAIPLYLGAIIYIYEVQNRRVDNQIKILIEGWKHRFENAGYSITYLTKHTGMCKPKHARSERVLAFVPIESAPSASANDTIGTTARTTFANTDAAASLVSKEHAFSHDTRSAAAGTCSSNIDLEMNTGLTSITQELSLVDQLQQDDKLYR